MWQTDVHNHEDNDLVGDNWQTQQHAYVKQNVITLYNTIQIEFVKRHNRSAEALKTFSSYCEHFPICLHNQLFSEPHTFREESSIICRWFGVFLGRQLRLAWKLCMHLVIRGIGMVCVKFHYN